MSYSALPILNALANKERLAIILHLFEQSATPTRLQEVLPHLSQPAMSQHLGVLRRAGLVIARRKGRSVTYFINHSLSLRKIIDAAQFIVEHCDEAA